MTKKRNRDTKAEDEARTKSTALTACPQGNAEQKLTATQRSYVKLHCMMTPDDAIRYLLDEDTPVVRSFGDTLVGMYAGGDVTPENSAGMKRELHTKICTFYRAVGASFTAQSVRNWLKSSYGPSSRTDVFRIAFALELQEWQLSYLLGLHDGYAIQYRDGYELTLAWFLCRCRADTNPAQSYLSAVRYFEALPAYEPNEDIAPEQATHLTHQIEDASRAIVDEETFRHFYDRNRGSFGATHARAYSYFMTYYDLLTNPYKYAYIEQCLLEEIEKNENLTKAEHDKLRTELIKSASLTNKDLESLLTMGVFRGVPVRNLGPALQAIRKNWPNETALINMKNHQKDVTRKVLLLFYVATENLGVSEDTDAWYCDMTVTLEDRISGHLDCMNAILSDCGMAPLDLRNAFDWLIVCTTILGDRESEKDDLRGMSDRLSDVIDGLYRNDLGPRYESLPKPEPAR